MSPYSQMTVDGSKKEAVDPPGWVTIKAGNENIFFPHNFASCPVASFLLVFW